ncbi:MAG: ThuA domain-containing protein [Planctomycetes bacterium]|nr:ThuA domain-containing protein [Planctomycetota bacterium]
MHRTFSIWNYTIALLIALSTSHAIAAEKVRTLIVDGQNNHKVWPTTTKMMKQYLEQTGLFTVDVATTAPAGADPNFHPAFNDYQLVVSNYNGAPWPESTQADFEKFARSGGGVVIVHAADNAFGNWAEYNRMIGLGGWGGRNQQSGPFVYLDKGEKLVRDEAPGNGGHHGSQHPFQVVVRDAEHPITRGMPRAWMHAKDELYDSLRGPALEMEVLATAYADPATGGTGRHEPMMMTVKYHAGRVFHTPMGHAEYSQECVGFIITLQRGAEWAATGKVTQSIPTDFPTATEERARKFAAGAE